MIIGIIINFGQFGSKQGPEVFVDICGKSI